MLHTQYNINKIRFGSDGKFGSWEYEAVSKSPDYQSARNAKRGITARYNSIDNLAKELATFPRITDAGFFPDCAYIDGPRVSLGKGTLTQEALVSDEELGELAMLVLKYAKK